MKYALSIIILCFLTWDLSAQSWINENSFNRLSVQLSGGPNFYHGDIDNRYSLSGNAGVGLSISEVFTLKPFVSYGILRGDGIGTHFTNRYFHYGARMEMLPLNLFGDLKINQKLNPYIFIGGGKISSRIVDLSTFADGSFTGKPYEDLDFMLQAGAGVRLYLNTHFDLDLRYNYQLAQSDLLDGHQMGSTSFSKGDAYSSVSVGIIFKFGKRGAEHMDWKSREKEEMKTPVVEPVESGNEQTEPAPEEIVEIDPEMDPEPEMAPEQESYEDTIEFDPDTKVETVYDLAGSRGDHVYYIIGGSFMIKQNAFDFRDALKETGVDAFVMTNPDKTLYRVCLSAYDDPADTYNALQAFRTSHDPETWMIINEARY